MTPFRNMNAQNGRDLKSQENGKTMKTMKLVTGLVMSAQFAAFGQAGYDPIVSESKLWSSLSGGYGAMMIECCIQTSFMRFEAGASTAGTGEMNVLVSTDSLKTWKVAGYIREFDQAVYFRDAKNVEAMIYDFGAREGQTLRLATYCNNVYHDMADVKVVHIDTVEYQSKRRKRMEVNYDGRKTDYWIEGIGSEFGLFNSCVGMVGGFRELLCVQDRDSLVYKNMRRGTCYVSKQSVGLGKSIAKDFKVYFENSNRRMKVESPDAGRGLSYSIRNLEGQEVGSGQLSGSWIDLNLEEGAYVLRISEKNQQVFSRQFVVTK